ncbi:hypothetical protein [Deinococcus aestuarii]|uniref:hypothetical protein n=1 Tax=Deinococcus aestuarii TaxID=2774531 RepID=UPI001C0D5B8D|nr:hypothetical protein [Deinococcus aestuarii]
MGRAAGLILQGYAVTLVGVAVGVCSARALALEERGTLALLLLAGQLFSRFGALGFEQLVQKHGFSLFGRAAYHRALLLGCATLLPLMWGFLVFCRLPAVYLLPTFLAAVVVAVLKVNTAYLIHLGRLRELFVINLGQALVQLALFLAAYATHRSLYFYGAWLLTVTLACGLSLSRVRPLLPPGEAGPAGARGVWRESRAYTTVALPETVLTFCLELPLIRVLLGGANAGLYAISNTFTTIYFQVFAALSAVVIQRPLGRRAPLYAALALLGLVMVALCRPAIVLLYGETYAGASRYVEWMLPATFLLGVARLEQVTAGRQAPFAFQVLIVLAFCALLASTLLLGSPGLVVPWIALSYALCSLAVLLGVWWGRPGKRAGSPLREGV